MVDPTAGTWAGLAETRAGGRAGGRAVRSGDVPVGKKAAWMVVERADWMAGDARQLEK
jgi:hypothetical protein